jgi:hypothetical protein
MPRYGAAAALAAAASLLLAACSASTRPPLVNMMTQEGEQVCFPVPKGGAQYTVRSYTGYAISPPGPAGEGGSRCTALAGAISAAWPSS